MLTLTSSRSPLRERTHTSNPAFPTCDDADGRRGVGWEQGSFVALLWRCCVGTSLPPPPLRGREWSHALSPFAGGGRVMTWVKKCFWCVGGGVCVLFRGGWESGRWLVARG